MNRPLAKVLFINLLDGQDAHPTRVIFSCGMGILPVLVIFARGLMLPNGSTLPIELVIDTGFSGDICSPPEAVSLLRFPLIYDVPANLADNLKAIRF